MNKLSEYYSNFPTNKTLKVDEFKDISKNVENMIDNYIKNKDGNFSCRILLPRNENNNNKAKKIGLNIQVEFLTGLRRRKINTRLREIKYIHDDEHFGWILLSKTEYEKVEQSLKEIYNKDTK
ncbi:MAG: hypothetical protein ACPKQO_11590 [Nitrososphaeraceae archaeon]